MKILIYQPIFIYLLNNLLNQIGYLSAQKHGLLHQFGETNKKVEEFKSVLEAEYGEININVETGVGNEADVEMSGTLEQTADLDELIDDASLSV